jgi:hypothetical protein
MRVDHQFVKLGRQPFVHIPGTPTFKAFKSSSLPAPPDSVDYTCGVTEFGLYLNGPNGFTDPTLPDDVVKIIRKGLGNCTVCGPMHGEQIWSLNSRAGGMVKLNDSDALTKYEAWDGYVPGNPYTDQGGMLQNVMQQWRKQSFPGCFCLDAFASIHEVQSSDSVLTNPVEFKTAVWLLGGANVGVDLPLAWQGSEVWDIGDLSKTEWQPASWGPHCIWCVGYDKDGAFFISWGEIYHMTWPAFMIYVEETWAPVSADWIKTTGIAPSGFDLDGCVQALDAIAA